MTEMMTEHVSKAQATLLAMHAIHVQGGFSTPEIEAERAEKDIARGGQIDWDKFSRELVQATNPHKQQVDQEIQEAAEAEGLAPMPADLVAYREEMVALKAQAEVLEGRKKEIQEIFSKRLEQDGLQGYMLHGKVHARVSHGLRRNVDTKKLKEQMPHIFAQFTKLVSYVSVRVD